MSGTVRMPSRAQALSQMMLRASLRELAWTALIAIDGCRQFISHGGRPPRSFVPGSIPACLRKRSSSVGSACNDFFSSAVSGRTLS